MIRRLLKAVKRRLRSYVVRRHYGVSRPRIIVLPGSTTPVHIDPLDGRAYKMLVAGPLFGRLPRNQPFWREACQGLAPTLALDIGLNFGECLFTATYARHTEAHGFEANARLEPFVRRSLRAHPARDQLHLHFGIVASQSQPAAPFLVDRHWSGSSTAVTSLRAGQPRRYQSIQMPMVAIDTVLAPRRAARPGSTLVFKLAIEGFEFQALRGMDRTLSAVQWALGLIDFNTARLVAAGDEPRRFWEELQQRFAIFALRRRGRARHVESWEDLLRLCGAEPFQADLLVVAGSDERLDAFLDDWTVGWMARRAVKFAA